MRTQKRESSTLPTGLDVYFGLLALLRKAGVREPGGSVSCQRSVGMQPSYRVSAEPYVAARVQNALSKLLSRSVSFPEKTGVILSLEEASKVAACDERFSGPT
jgi:hypothetical protein